MRRTYWKVTRRHGSHGQRRCRNRSQHLQPRKEGAQGNVTALAAVTRSLQKTQSVSCLRDRADGGRQLLTVRRVRHAAGCGAAQGYAMKGTGCACVFAPTTQSSQDTCRCAQLGLLRTLRLAFRGKAPLHEAGKGSGHEDDDMTGLVAMGGSLQGKYRRGGATGWRLAESLQCGKRRGWNCRCRQPSSDASCGRCTRRFCIWCPPVFALTDNASVHRGFCRGRGWCASAIRLHCGVWRNIWDITAAVGERVLAHCSCCRRKKNHDTKEAMIFSVQRS